MTQADAYTPPLAKTMDDIDKVIDFINARVKPLRDAIPYSSTEDRPHQALLDMTTVIKGAAQAEIARGDNPSTLHFFLTIAARQWRDHPDFLPEWKN
ncbi:hypothetical protein [Streptomyces olivochromogenes]|uniref:Uncharacterized protein n=1 Tax=Streptomyces olivochromogenes TaxID=1963 RepID=A0A250VTC7_STROL|nr:hypothetical protein [Streptomyces olivochromogenes]KUN38211.1 hypothetical protein AQJ27_44725 [Streptomyces olivochromogenes]GAX57354.1 hypothetical protein SO3561_08924 [Streptomyces olivochromogenes]